MTDELAAPAEGMNRRDMLRRSAIIGGAGVAVWAAPSITTFAPRAFANTGSDVPPGTGLPSFVMIWYRCGGDYYRVKYEANGDNTAIGQVHESPASLGSGHATKDTENLYGQEEARAAAKQPDGTKLELATSKLDERVTVEAEGNVLQVKLGSSGCTVIGWMLHDGSCEPKYRSFTSPYNVVGESSSGAVGPTDLSGGVSFVWMKCSEVAPKQTVEHEGTPQEDDLEELRDELKEERELGDEAGADAEEKKSDQEPSLEESPEDSEQLETTEESDTAELSPVGSED